MSDEREIRMPIDDDNELIDLVERFVMPGGRYLELLHGSYLRKPEEERSRFVAALRSDANQISDYALGVLFSSEWRSRLTAAYLVAASRREQFVPGLGELLIESQLVYSGQGYCIALASIGTSSAAERLSAYLERWLPDVDARYDQWWAMAALVCLDRRSATNYSDRFLGPGGAWERWDQGRLDLDEQVERARSLLASLGA